MSSNILSIQLKKLEQELKKIEKEENNNIRGSLLKYKSNIQ